MITRERLDYGMCGTGGMDFSGEWQWSGNYYMTLHRDVENKQKHNYYIQFYRRGSIRKTNGWHGYVGMALTASNTSDITVCRFKGRSLKKCKDEIFNWINHFEGTRGDDEVKEWRDKHRTPVFIIENNEPAIVSHTYKYLTHDFNDHASFSYWKDQDYEYKPNVKYYTVSTYRDELSLSRTEISWGGYCSGTSDFDDKTKKEIINKIFNEAKRNPIYSSFVNKTKELI